MANYSFQADLIKSLQAAIDSDGEFTYIYNPRFYRELKIFCSKSSIDWVLQYKENRLKDFLEYKKKINFDIDDDLFIFIYYFYAFVLHDIWHLHKYIPGNINNVIDIGAGIGLFEIYLNHIRPEIKNFTIIEKENLFHQNKIIDVLKMSKDTAISNKLTNCLFYNDSNFSKINKKFDLVLSFRSWCYKYDVETYLDFILRSITRDTIVIVDIRNHFNKDKLLKNFKESFILTNYPDHKRYLLKNFLG